MGNNGTFSTNYNNIQEAKIAAIYIKKGGFWHVKGQWENPKDYESLGLPVYKNNHHKGYKNPCDLVRKNQIIDLKFYQATYIAQSEVVIASSQRAAYCKLDQKPDYIVEIVNHNKTMSLRINVSKLKEMGDFVSGPDAKKVKLNLKGELIPKLRQSGKGGKYAHRKIIKLLREMGVGTYGKLYREWDL